MSANIFNLKTLKDENTPNTSYFFSLNNILNRTIMSHILKYKAYYLVFLISLGINLLSLNYKQLPITFPDSESYISISKQINQGKWPNFSSRTPTYPLYLSLFTTPNKLSSSIAYSTIIGAIGAIFLLWIIKLFISKQILASALTIFIMSDFGIINYQSTILTESIAPTLMLFSLFANLILIKNKKTKLLDFIIISLADFMFMFIKPTFVILPLSLKLIYLLTVIFFPKIIPKKKNKPIVVSCLINIVFIITFLGYNYHGLGKIQISSIREINTFGKIISYGYLNSPKQYSDAPPNVLKIIEVYNKNNRPQSPYTLSRLIQKEKIRYEKAKVNRYILSKNKTNFVTSTIKLIPSNFNRQPAYYSKTHDQFSNNSVFINVPNFLRTTFESAKVYSFTINLYILIYYLIKQKQKAFYLGAILFFVFSTICVISTFSYAEFSRLRQPIDPLLNLLLFFPFIFIYIEPRKHF